MTPLLDWRSVRHRVLAPALLLLLTGGAPEAVAQGRDRPAEWLGHYLRIDTSNPPGNEQRAAALLRGVLHREGIATRLYVNPVGRTSLYARLQAARPRAGALVLLHHMDVVPAGEGWTAPPFDGALRGGALWGRGAVDDKSLGIAHLAALIDLKRSGARLTRDVIFLAVADEEAGGGGGTAWLLESHPELFEGVDAVLGEGGSNRAYRERIAWWGIEVAQKRPLWLEVSAGGRPGHGSTLNLHTAPHRLIRALERVVNRPPLFRLVPEVRAYFQAVAPHQSPVFRRIVAELDQILELERPEERLLPGLPTYLADSIQVNVLAAGERINAVPDRASARLDVRLLPDTDDVAFLEELRELLGNGIGVEVLLSAPRVEPSPNDHPVYRCVEGALSSSAPVVPAFIPGVTDSRYFRERGIPAYGFSPFALDGETLRGIHGPDERIPLASFRTGVETMKRVLRACATG